MVQLFRVLSHSLLRHGTEAGRETQGMSPVPGLPPLTAAPPSTSRPLFLEWSHLKEANRYKVSPEALWEILIPSTNMH